MYLIIFFSKSLNVLWSHNPKVSRQAAFCTWMDYVPDVPFRILALTPLLLHMDDEFSFSQKDITRYLKSSEVISRN